jgi:hypothetical protein
MSHADQTLRLLIYTTLLPLPLIVLLHGLILLGAHWVYFVLTWL